MATAHRSFGPGPDGAAPAASAGVPLFHAAWLFACGIVLAHWFWIRPSFTLIALVPAALLCVLAGLRAQRIAWLPLALVWMLAGVWSAEMEPHPAPQPTLLALSDGLLRTVEGTVVDDGPVRSQVEQNLDEPSQTAPAERVDLRVATIEQVSDEADAQVPAGGAVRLTVRWPAGQVSRPLGCGERIRVAARLLPPETYHDPGAWSREDYLLDEGVTSSASLTADRVERLGRAPGWFLNCRLTGLQHATTDRLLSLPAAMRKLPAPLRMSQEDAAMLAAIVAGDRTYLTHSLRVGFERTGSFHMLVVSGFHLAIVAACIFWLARRARLPRLPATLATIVVSFAYALFTGFATPIQRSFWMVALYLVGRLVYRDRSPLNVIGFAALCLMAVSPRSLFDASFQMTLLAVVAIAGVAAPLLGWTLHPYGNAARDLRLTEIDIKLAPRLAAFRVALRMVAMRLAVLAGGFSGWRVFPWMVRSLVRLIELMLIAYVVEMAMTLPMAVYFHRITFYALPVNLAILPLLTVLMPAALLTLLALLVWPAAAIVPAVVTAALLHLGVGLVHLFGSMRMGDIRIPEPTAWQQAVFWVLLATAIALAAGRARRRWMFHAAWAALLLAACSAVVPRPVVHPRGALLVEAIDVGQGDSLLLITPEGKTMLVDAGGFGGGPRQAPQEFDIGEEVVSPALWARGIRHLDVVALSHAHSDHMGGMAAVVRNFHPSEFWVGNNPHFAAYDALLDEARSFGGQVRSLRAGDALDFGSLKIAVLAPLANYHPGAEPANNDSLVLHVAYGATSVMLEGDAEAPIEKAMLAEPGLKSTLLKVGHHGSITSTTPEFLARVSPQFAVISAGLHNRYGHPRGEVLAELEAAHVRTLRTDLDGASCFLVDGKSVTADYVCGWRGER
jgi:competence protein ComEC